MGRLGGCEMGYGSDADVLFVLEPRPGADESRGQRGRHAVARSCAGCSARPRPTRRSGSTPTCGPEGRQGPLVRSLAAFREYYARWSSVWEAQALLRAGSVAGDADLGAEFVALVDPVRYPADGLTAEQVAEIRRIKARVEPSGCPAAPTRPPTPSSAGAGWPTSSGRCSCCSCGTPAQVPGAAARPHPRRRWPRPATPACSTPEDAEALAAAWRLASRARNAIMLVRGRPGDQLPRPGLELAGVARAAARPGPTRASSSTTTCGRPGAPAPSSSASSTGRPTAG